MTFELLVATRYLRARRKQAVISIITFIAILGVAAGVAALVGGNGCQRRTAAGYPAATLRRTGYVTIYPTVGRRIANYEELTKQIEEVQGVAAQLHMRSRTC